MNLTDMADCCYPGNMDNLAKDIEHAAKAAFIDKQIIHSTMLRPSIIDNSLDRQNDMLSCIKKGLSSSKEFMISVSFIRMSGLSMLLQTLKDIEGKGVRGRVITTDYLNYTEPKALRKLLEFPFIELKVATEEAFHIKGYLFDDGEKNTVIIGSSNITGGALKSNREWNLRTTILSEGGLNEEFRNSFDELWGKARYIDERWLSSYAARYGHELEIRRTIKKETRLRTYTIEPNPMQKAAALSLQKIRAAGKDKALLIAATGTGKTYLAAFDVRSFNPERMLFIVHREQILHDAAESFEDVLGINESDIGFLTGNNKDYNKRFLFTTNLTMSKPEIYTKFSRSCFDYIIIDAPAGIDDGMVLATGGCDMAIIVVTPEYASLRNADIVKKTIDAQSGDSTEEISIQVHEMLKDRNILIRRIHQAYPDLQARPEDMMKEWKAAKERFRQARKDTRKVMRDLRTAQKDRLTFDEEKWKKAVAKARQDQRRFEEELGKVREKFERRIRY